jgi:hypothetical protein
LGIIVLFAVDRPYNSWRTASFAWTISRTRRKQAAANSAEIALRKRYGYKTKDV